MEYCLHCMNKTNEKICPHCGEISEEIISAEYHLAAGTVLNGKYLVGSVIGEGGFGITYIGRDTNLDMKIAVKEYYPNGYANRDLGSYTVNCGTGDDRREFFSNGKDRFLKEARALAKFSGEQGIVNVRDFFEENNTAYIVMEYIDGKTLKDLIKRFGTLSAKKTKELLTPVMRSLIKIHKEGIIHRDISPSNIMITYDRQAKLLDFGAARAVTGDGNKSLSVLLKPGYAPEEQYRSKGNQGAWTDVYSLCATMYKCITGITPDEAPERVYNDELKAPSALGVKIDSGFEAALMKGLSVLQKDRYQSVDELMKGMEGIGGTEQEAEKTQAGEKTQSIFAEAQGIEQTASTLNPTPTPASPVQQPAYTPQEISQSDTFNNNVYQEATPHKAENLAPSPMNYQNDIPIPADDKTQYVFAETQDGGRTDFQKGAPFPSAQQIPPSYVTKTKQKPKVWVVVLTVVGLTIVISAVMFLRFILPTLLVNEDTFSKDFMEDISQLLMNKDNPATNTAPQVTTPATETATNSFSSDNGSFKHGYVQNGTWKSETFGICADLGSEWTLYDDEEIAVLNGMNEIIKANPRVYIIDDYDYLSENEKEKIYSQAEIFSKKSGFNIMIAITDDIGTPKTDSHTVEYTDDLYDSYCGINTDGILLLINNDTKYDYISTSGACINYYSDYCIELILDHIYGYIIDESFADAASAFIDKIEYYYDKEKANNQQEIFGSGTDVDNFTETILSALSTEGSIYEARFCHIDFSTNIITTDIIIGVDNLEVIMEDEAISEIQYARENLSPLEENAKSLGYSIDSSAITMVKFASSYHPSICITYTAGDQILYDQRIFIKSGKYMGIVIINSISEEELKSASEMFYALQ